MKSILILFLLVLILSLDGRGKGEGEALAHPGRLDDKGCHKVAKDYEYESGKILKAGTYHCHGKLNDTPLDGTQLLENPGEHGREIEQKKDKNK